MVRPVLEACIKKTIKLSINGDKIKSNTNSPGSFNKACFAVEGPGCCPSSGGCFRFIFLLPCGSEIIKYNFTMTELRMHRRHNTDTWEIQKSRGRY